MFRYLLLLVSLGCSASTVFGQSALERVLVPVVLTGQLPGANGSVWETRLSIANPGTARVVVEGIDPGCNFGLCLEDGAVVEPGSTIFPIPLVTEGALALLLRVGEGGDDLTIQLRVQDVSRQAETWGTIIPVVRERDAFTGKFNLVDIPVDQARSRSLLRVYSFSNDVEGAVFVRIFKIYPGVTLPLQGTIPDVLLGEHTLQLPRGQSSTTPGYAQLPLWLLAEVPDGTRLRIEVSPLTGGPIWGFVSVTNNQTQHVTAISPE